MSNIFYRRSVTRSYRRTRAVNNSAVGRVVLLIIRPRRNNQRRFNRRCYNERTFTQQVTRRVSWSKKSLLKQIKQENESFDRIRIRASFEKSNKTGSDITRIYFSGGGE